MFFFAIVFTLVVGWQAVWARINMPDPLQGRREFNVSSLRMIRERPWVGFGLGTWPYTYPAHAVVSLHGYVNAAHNDWAQWAAEGGLGFGCLMLGIFVWSVLRTLRHPWALGIPVVFIHCLVDFPLQIPALELWLFVMLGALAAVHPSHSHARVNSF